MAKKKRASKKASKSSKSYKGGSRSLVRKGLGSAAKKGMRGKKKAGRR